MVTANSKLGRELLDVLIRAGLVLVLAFFCYRVFKPFLDLMLWAVILAITLYPTHRALSARLGNRNGWSATLIVLLGFLVLVVPIYLISVSTFHSVEGLMATAKTGAFHIPPPSEKVASWPLVGQPIHDLWTRAATNLTAFIQPLVPQLRAGSLVLVGKLAGLGMTVMVFLGAVVVAGIILVFGERGAAAARRISSRLFDAERGPEIATLCTLTVRTVAQGVVGIAFIQMVLLGAGFFVMGIPGAGVLAIIVLLLGVAQIPASLVVLPVIGFAFYQYGATAGTIVFTIYSLVAGLADNVLKPILLGRGVDVPMPVILIGALGGMVSNGVIGLFIGPVALAVAYRLFWEWVDLKVPAEPAPAPPLDAAEPAESAGS